MRCASCAGELPPNARFCPFCGVPSGPAAPVEERRVVTVVFCDLVGSTALSGVLDPETLRTVTLRYFDLMRARLEEFGGTVEKFIGDAVMAVFGVPVTHEDDAGRALAAALAMLDAVRELNETELRPTLGIRLDVRIGVNTGPVVTSADISTRQALVSGETVNIAARLQQHAGEGQVLIGPQTRQAAGGARTERVGPLRLKGKTEPVTAYRLLGVVEDDPEVSRRFDTPFVGRTAQLAVLREALRDAVTGQGDPHLLVVRGEAGMGKTRLLHEWRRGSPRAFRYGSGRCRPYGERGSLAPLADAVRQLLRAAAEVPEAADALGANPSGVAAEVPEAADASAANPSGEAGEVPEAADASAANPSGVAGDDRPGPDESTGLGPALAVLSAGLLADGTPSPSVDDTCAALVDLLALLSRREPVVLVVDDCQWAGDPLLDLLGTLADELASSAVLFVCATRPDLYDRRPGWGTEWPQARSLTLPGLTPEEAGAVARALTPDGAAAAGVPGSVLEAAGGNPFHLEQLLAALAEPGSGYRADGRGDLPTSLVALLGARIGALGRAERAALDLAAVVGRDFTVDDVVGLARTDREGRPGGGLYEEPGREGAAAELWASVRSAVVRLRGHRLVGAPDGPGHKALSLRFSSGVVHEVTYQSMAKRVRAERHERLAVLLAAHLPAGAAQTAERSAAAAGHLERAYRYRTELGAVGPRADELRRTAVRHLVDAGSQALARSDLAWADTLLERAVALSRPADPEWPSATRRLGEVRLATGRTEEGRALLTSVLAAVEGASPAVPLAFEATSASARRTTETTSTAARSATEAALASIPPATEATPASVRRTTGAAPTADPLTTETTPTTDPPAVEATASVRPAVQVDASTAGLETEATSTAARSATEAALASIPPATEATTASVRRTTPAAPTTDPLTTETTPTAVPPAPATVEAAHARLSLATVSASSGRGAAAEAARQTLPVFERAADDLGQARACIRLAQESQLQGRHRAADEFLTRGLGHAARSGAEPERALALGAIGISLWRGPVPVPDAVARARALLDEHGERRPTVRLTLNCPLAVLLALQERWDEARACLDRARRYGDALGYAEGAVVLPLFGATVEALAGRAEQALLLLDEAAGAARALRAGAMQATVARAAARLLVDADRIEEAAERLAAADRTAGPDRPARSDAADLDGLRGRIAAARALPAEADDLSERAVRTAAGTDSPAVQAVAWLDRADVLRRTGRPRDARAAAARAERRFAAKGDLPSLRRAARFGVDPTIAPAAPPQQPDHRTEPSADPRTKTHPEPGGR
ncbi:adenylate/guanylate cyclase domain-containing protein [Actinacidiphila acididurans]|uniref:AAA family ATPase n=1 Tax=Actinacidiphila acididurans TaxID=2784346 RepID=A0ABS2TZW6_9ACTN|nr:adenylate/guanylate cyclase domain-containing protein [Actinacidiphila acididurans]MBM9508890.1 AAA family ATPase [Actinacidiphila acididurans]